MATFIPSGFLSREMPEGLSAFKPRQVRLKPVNDNGNKTYSGTTDNRILFHIGAYPATFLNNERSFLRFKAEALPQAGLTEAVRIREGMPVFERVVVRSGGVLLADVRDYQELDTVLMNFYDDGHLRKVADHIGNYKALLIEGFSNDDKLRERAGAVKTVRKQLHGCGIFDPKSFLPIGLLGSQTGAPALEIELFLAPPEKVVEKTDGTPASQGAGFGYLISEVRFDMELTSVPADMYASLNERLMSGGAYTLDFPAYRSYRNYLSGNDKYDLTIHNSVKNLEEVVLVMRKSGDQYPLRFGGGGGRIVGAGITDDAQVSANIDDFKVKSHLFKFGADLFPSDGRVENDDEDCEQSLLHALRGKDMIYSKEQPWASQVNRAGVRSWEELGAFCIVQNFKSTSGNAKNGMATASVGVPLIAEIEFDVVAGSTTGGKQDTSGFGIEAIAFTRESMKLRIGEEGRIEVLEA